MIIELHSTSKSSLSQNERRVILNSEKKYTVQNCGGFKLQFKAKTIKKEKQIPFLTVCFQQSDPIAQDNRVSQFDISTTFKYIKIIQQFSNHILNHRLKTGCIAILTR